MNISDLLFLQFQKKQLQELLQNHSYNEKSWISIETNETNLDSLNIKKQSYESMLETPDLSLRRRSIITSDIVRIQRQIDDFQSRLYIALIKTIPKETIQSELEKINQKEKEYSEPLLKAAKEQYNKELQSQMK